MLGAKPSTFYNAIIIFIELLSFFRRKKPRTIILTKRIDINCDFREGCGNDHEVMPYISSCSIACGGHFGTSKTIIQTLQYAEENDVKVGAHPAYPRS